MIWLALISMVLGLLAVLLSLYTLVLWVRLRDAGGPGRVRLITGRWVWLITVPGMLIAVALFIASGAALAGNEAADTLSRYLGSALMLFLIAQATVSIARLRHLLSEMPPRT